VWAGHPAQRRDFVVLLKMQLDFVAKRAQYLDVDAKENTSWLGRLVIALLLTLIGGAVTAVIV
jgi:hypothetical protein